MATSDPRVDAYIARSADFARPILSHIRKLVHAGCPAVEETLKWGMPYFMYKGILCHMAAFNSHCAFGFWKRDLLATNGSAEAKVREPAMGQFGRLTCVADLPDEKTLLRYVQEAAAQNDQAIKPLPKTTPKRTAALEVPDYFLNALRKNREALATFDAFSPSNKKEYVEWVTEAKTEETRKRRLETAILWMAEGKIRHWKYGKK